MTKEVMPVQEINAVEVFNNGGLDKMLDQIRQEATAEVFDVNTKKGPF